MVGIILKFNNNKFEDPSMCAGTGFRVYSFYETIKVLKANPFLKKRKILTPPSTMIFFSCGSLWKHKIAY